MQLVTSASIQSPSISYRGYRLPKEAIAFSVWLYFRFSLSLRMVKDMLAALGIMVTYETVRRWADKFGIKCARRLSAMKLASGDKWHLDEKIVKMNGRLHWLWRAIDQYGAVLDVLVQSYRDARAANWPMQKLLKKQGYVPRVNINDKLRSYGAAFGTMGLSCEYRQY